MSEKNILLSNYVVWLENSDKSTNTIITYQGHIHGFLKWYQDSFGNSFSKLYRVNVKEYKNFILNITSVALK